MVRKVFILAAVAMLLPAATAMAFHPGRCEPCHVPHQSDISTTGVPLWSGARSDVTTFINSRQFHILSLLENDVKKILSFLLLALITDQSSKPTLPFSDGP